MVSPISVFVLAGAVLATTTTALAQDRATGGGQVLTVDLTFEERTIEGRLEGCELTYLLAFEDHIYRKGAPAAMRGSLLLMALRQHPDKEPGITFKAKTFDLVGSQPEFAPINYAFVSTPTKSFARHEFGHFTCEDGGFCAVYGLFKSPGLVEALISGSVTINFNRRKGASDVSVPVNFARDKPAVHREFVACVMKLLPVIQEKIEAIPN